MTTTRGADLQRFRGILAGLIVALPLSMFMVLWLHAGRELALILAGVVGIAIFLVVATRSDEHDLAADVAWREAAPDLPPASERAAMELAQANLPAPTRPRKGVPAAQRPNVKDASTGGAENIGSGRL
jgi:hypothetical protein